MLNIMGLKREVADLKKKIKSDNDEIFIIMPVNYDGTGGWIVIGTDKIFTTQEEATEWIDKQRPEETDRISITVNESY